MASSLSDLEKRGADLGLTREEVAQALSLGRPTQDLAWFEGRDLKGRAQQAARELFEVERILEYECYDTSWRPQGRGVVALKDWEDQEKCLFLGVHGPSSDGYYDYFVNRDMGPENGLYHVCDCEAARCRVRKARGDRRELIHVDRWRLQTPATMMESPYLARLGAELGEKALSATAREKKAAAPIGSGLDAALLGEAGPGGEEMEADKRSRKRSRSPRGEQGSMGRYLTQQAMKQGESKAASQKKKKKEQSKKKEKKKRQSSSSSSEKSESSSFQLAPARGGELWRAAQKKPGRLTRLGLDEMTRYLADRADDTEADQRWKGQKITAYLHQVLLVTNPPQKIGLRMLRELQTIAVTLDHLLSGRLPQATDTLMQRLKACEMSLTEGGWTTARHLEIIPPSSASLVQAEERELAAKQEIRSLKLKDSMKRASK